MGDRIIFRPEPARRDKDKLGESVNIPQKLVILVVGVHIDRRKFFERGPLWV